MFENVGEKIKLVAKVIFVLGVIVSLVAGIMIFLSLSAIAAIDSSRSSRMIAAGVVSILVTILSILFSYVSSLFVCGFGILVDNAEY